MNKRLLQVLTVLFIITAIGGIFIVKKTEDHKKSVANTTFGVALQPGNVGDIPLNASSIDLSALKQYGVPFMIDFGYEACVWCQRLEPTLEMLHSEWAGKALILYLDIEKYPKATGNFNLSAFPTQYFFNADGTAYKPSDAIRERVEFSTYTKNGQSYTLHIGYIEENNLRAIFAEMGLD